VDLLVVAGENGRGRSHGAGKGIIRGHEESVRRSTMGDLGEALIRDTRKRLVEAYPEQVRAALATLDEDEIWARPNSSSNSVGNLVLHLVGSTRHFLGRGVGGSEYVRQRPDEFVERVPRAELERRLEEMVTEATRILDALEPGGLLETSDLGGETHTRVALLLRVAHHWSVHTGQILFAVKARHEGRLDEIWTRTMR
jgi:uncharacterized damage-inducible protein DinB